MINITTTTKSPEASAAIQLQEEIQDADNTCLHAHK